MIDPCVAIYLDFGDGRFWVVDPIPDFDLKPDDVLSIWALPSGPQRHHNPTAAGSLVDRVRNDNGVRLSPCPRLLMNIVLSDQHSFP
jgi:hypothetical protein